MTEAQIEALRLLDEIQESMEQFLSISKRCFGVECLTLEQLLAESSPDAFEQTEEDYDWINMRPVGKEQ